MNVENNRIYYLDGLRAVAILFVVGMHALAYVQLEESAKAWVGLVVNTAAVPIFFMCDGFLFGRNALDSNKPFLYWAYMQKSAKRLLMPWVIFSLLYAGLRLVFEAFGLLPMHLVFGKSIDSIAQSIYASNTAQQMYFLFSLFLIRTLVKFSRFLLTLSWVCLVVVFGLYTVGFYLVEESMKPYFAKGLDPVLHGIWGFQYYLAGLILAKIHAITRMYAKSIAIGALAMLIVIHLTLDSSTFERVVGTYLFMLFMYFFMLGFVNRQNVLSKIGLQTMGVYLLHAPVILKLISLVCEKMVGHNLGAYFTIVAMTFAISYGLALIIARSNRLRFLFGQ